MALAGHDAVLSGPGNPLWLKGEFGPAILAAAVTNVVTAMRDGGVSRIVVPLAWGTGASRPHASPLVRAAAATLIRRDFRDFGAAEPGVRPFTVDFAGLDDVRGLGQELLEALPRVDVLAANVGAVVPGVRPPTGSSRRSRSARGCSCACWRPTKTSTVATSSTGALL